MPIPKHIVAVTGFITNAHNELLLIRSPRRGWECPGGQVEEGESLTQALHREIMEETGITVEVGQMVGVYSNIEPPPKVIFSFLCRYHSGELTTSSESVEIEWVRRDEVLTKITHPAIQRRVRDLLAFSGQVVYQAYTLEPYQTVEESFLNS